MSSVWTGLFIIFASSRFDYFLVGVNLVLTLVELFRVIYEDAEEESRMKQVDATLSNPQIIQAFEAVLNQAGRKNVNAPDDGPKLIEAMRKVAKQAKR
ncbi:hypothetical protein LT722_06550 [Pseudomonas syringae pv. syringae]|nr:hypothetical protein [Pseudomonas syringae pv. syringae]MCK9761314.1 hypothetical protein [Pseudomonas syringae pv. syringae]